VIADSVQFLGGRSEAGGEESFSSGEKSDAEFPPAADDDIPF
jgi:hypothetical protein